MADARNLFTLLECAAGYALFEVVAFDEIGSLLDGETVTDLSRFARAVKLKAFTPFETAQEALVNANAIANHEMSETLRNFLELNLPLSSSSSSSSSKKKSKTAPWALGVIDAALATSIQDGMTSKSSIACRSDDTVREVLRGCRMHLTHFVKGLEGGQVERKAQLGLGHAYSRCKVKFNPARSDNMIIQSIALLDQMDKDLNTFAMRIREWYCWHFPELKDLVKDNIMFARAAAYIQDKSTLKEDKLDGLTEIVGDEDVAKAIVAAAKTSMGMDCSPVDMINIINFTQRMVKLAEYRKQLSLYLNNKMSIVAPNLSALIGDTVAARLISKAGSLTNLAKAPASTVQILGAEKALFRALKTKGNTPKYGLIYHSTFIGRAESKNKGRISRYLANKCAIATRIDSFSEEPSRLYGEKLRDQVEERLKFYETGAAPRRNVDVMEEVAKQLKQSTAATNTDVDDDDAMDVEESTMATATRTPESSKKKSKKDKKRKADAENDDEEMKEEPAKVVVATPAKETQVVVDDQPSSKKKKKRAKTEESTPDAKPQEREDDDKTPSSSQEAKSDKKKKKSKKDDVAAATPTPKQEEASAEKSDKKKKKKSKKE